MSDKPKLRPAVVAIVDEVSRLTLLEATALVEALEDRLGVSATPGDRRPFIISNPPWIFLNTPPEGFVVFDVWVDAPGSDRKFLLMLLRERLNLTLDAAIALVAGLPGRLGLQLQRFDLEPWLADLKRLGLTAKAVEVPREEWREEWRERWR